ncbi:MAG: hypothetical protein U1G07_26385 [Verrucomicrobiota bacterium]
MGSERTFHHHDSDPIGGGWLAYLVPAASETTPNPNKPVLAVRPGGQGDLTLAAGTTSSPSIAWLAAARRTL